MKKIIARAKAPTPQFFRKLKIIGLSLAAAGTAILTYPLALPALLVSIAGYTTLAGTIITAISQLTVEDPIRIK